VGALDAATVAPDARVDEQAVLGDLAAEAPTPPAARVEAGAEAPESVEVAAETESEPAPQVAEPAPQVAEPAPLEVHPEPEPEPATPIAAAEEVVPEPSAPPPAAETPRTRSIRRYRPGQSLDDEIAAYEAALGRPTDEAATAPGAGATERREPVPPQVAPEPAPAQGPDYEAVAATEAADLAAEATPADAVPSAPAPFTTELEPAAALEPAPEPEPIAAAAAEPEPFAGPIPPVRADPGPPAPAPTFAPPGPRSSEPVAWPSHPRWPSAPAVRDASTGAPVSDPLAAALARRATDAMWAQSANELLRAQPIPTPATLAAAAAAANAVQSCQGCGLSLSATARFCRRCGTRQGG
jgi:ribosomal protein L40E